MQVRRLVVGHGWRHPYTRDHTPIPDKDPDTVNRTFKLLLPLLLTVALAGCQGLMPRPAPVEPVEPVKAATVLPFVEPPAHAVDLNGDLVFSYLVGELASRRKDLELAYPHYLHVARLVGDAYAAEKATWIAAAEQDLQRFNDAAALWVELAPNDSRARVKYAEVLFRQGDTPAALGQLDALGRIIAAQHADPYAVGGALFKTLVPTQFRVPLMAAWVATAPPNASALTVLGGLYLQAGDFQAAEKAMRQAIELAPNEAKAWRGLVLALMEQKHNDDALALGREATEKFPQETALRLLYGRLLYEAGHDDLALEQFRLLHQQLPDDGKVAYMQGLLAMRVEAWDEAREVFSRLRGDSAFKDEATYYLAQIEESAGNAALAAGLYADVGPGSAYVDAGMRLAALEAEQGKLAEARARLAALRASEPARAVELYLLEARLLWDAGEQAQAFALYDEAQADYPENLDLLYARGLHAGAVGRVDELEQAMRRILARQPNHADALNALGYTLADQTHRYQEALELVSRAYQLAPAEPAILDSLGWVHYRLGHYDEALHYLRQAFEALPDGEIAAHLGEVLWVTGDRGEARRVWRAGISVDPDNTVLRAVMERFDVTP